MLHIGQNKYTGVMEITEEGRMVGSKEMHRLLDEGKAELVQTAVVMTDWLDQRPSQVFIDPPIFRLQLPEHFDGRVPQGLILPILKRIGGVFIADQYFNRRTITFTFPKQTTAKSLRKARALRQQIMRKLNLDEQPYLNISTFTIDRHQAFIESIVENQSQPDYYNIMGGYVRYLGEERFVELNRQRVRYLNKLKRLVKAGKLAPSWLNGLGS